MSTTKQSSPILKELLSPSQELTIPCDNCGGEMILIMSWPAAKSHKPFNYFGCVPGCMKTKKVEVEASNIPIPSIH